MKKYLIILFACYLSSCSSNSQENKLSIKGNWYSFDSLKKNQFGESFINYSEVYLDDNMLFTYNELTGMSSPKKYLISNDSLFTNFKNQKSLRYIGTLDTISKGYFSIKNKRSVKFYYKIQNGMTLEDVIPKKGSLINDYSKDFYNRLNNQITIIENR